MGVYGIFGAGGSGREILPLVQQQLGSVPESETTPEVIYIVDDEYKTASHADSGEKILCLSEFANLRGVEKNFTIAVGDPRTRRSAAERLMALGANPFTTRAPTHVSIGNNVVGVGAVFANYTQITCNVSIGKFFYCNYYSSVSHDCQIGDYVTFGPGVRCTGRVIIEDEVYVGAGAIIRDGSQREIRIGSNSIIGMGSVITKSVPPNATVVGNPARRLS